MQEEVKPVKIHENPTLSPSMTLPETVSRNNTIPKVNSLNDEDGAESEEKKDSTENELVGSVSAPETSVITDTSSTVSSIKDSSSSSTKSSEPPQINEDAQEDIKMRSGNTRSMELNVAYEVFEKMRRLNLEMECAEAGINFTDEDPINYNVCTRCLIEQGPRQQHKLKTQEISTNNKPLIWLRKVKDNSKEFINASQKSIKNKTQKAPPPCLLCAAPTCKKHASPTFQKEKITLCNSCVESLEFDFDKEDLEAKEMNQQVNQLVDLYDRSILLLKYCSQFMLDTADRMEKSTKNSNKVGVGSSSVGLVSGALGVAAACTILTPAGPPLLIASLVFGGSATAVQTGSEVLKYHSEPQRLADRILALRGVVETILRKITSMRETTLMPYLNRAVLALTTKKEKPHDGKRRDVEKAASLIGSTAATAGVGVSLGLVAIEEGAVVSRFMTRASTNLARSARFAQIAGGALSAACIIIEARELTNAISQIKKGNPCEKATELRHIYNRIQEEQLPPTLAMDAICRSYAKVKGKQLAAKRLIKQQNLLEMESFDDEVSGHNDLELVEEVVSSLEAARDAVATQKDVSKTLIRPKIRLSKSSLLERVQRFKAQETSKAAAEINLIV